ncbi:PTR2-domain-containing protein [Basidiobolus meristosporus CBS 931.73]|uniref:PTR2-domain-containing protein n=1 Tax=Basidiobolus meristosporus CBS 931.73 TaxID=1314790 RepID=A0A1Y1YPY8_9FUNG|nr:PTR2-domain-containing protein [Basidiobolus meristosporus CBS 931.73]|eukprot:ORY00039.1 PTR2-domain-containing protein [Basidiobolus meristosporus CBS 931.73]
MTDKDVKVDNREIGHEEGLAQSYPKEDIQGLRRVAGRIPIAAWFIIINEFCERFAYYGGSAPFTNYVQFPPNDPNQAGALGKGQSVSTALKQFFTFFCYLTPLFGAVIADQYLGKYKTILIFSIIYMLGWLILTITAIPSIMFTAGYPGYIVSLIVIGLGTGGIKPLVSPMAADQYSQAEPEVCVIKGERVVVDPELNAQHLYNWFYWAVNVGSLIGGIVTPQIELHSGFWLAYLVPTCMFVVAIVVFVAGNKLYRKVPPSGDSAIVKGYRCYKYAYQRASKASVKPANILDAAKSSCEGIPAETESERASRVWDDRFVDDLKQTIMACKIFIPLAIYWTAYNQITSNLISQAAVMDLPKNIPNDIVNNIDPITLIIFLPLMDLFVYPILRKMNMNPRPMTRITIGFFLGALAMAASAIVQNEIYRRQDHGLPLLSVWWQIPAYVLIALSEIFASVTSLEYSYTHAPDSLKGTVSALSLLPNAVAALLGIALAPVSEDPYLTWLYAGIGIACFVVGILFWFFFKHYDALDDEIKRQRMLADTGDDFKGNDL